MIPEETEAARLAEEQRLQQESQTQNQNQNQNQTTDIERLIQTTLADAERRANQAEARSRELEDRLQLSNQNQNQVQNQNPTQEIDQSQFWTKPLDIINSAVAAQVKPLNDFVAQMQIKQQYDNLKAGYKSNPGFAGIENMVDQFMNGVQPTHANMQIAIQRAIGVLALNGAFNNNNNQAPQNQNNNQSEQIQNQNQNQNPDPKVVGNITPNNNFLPPHLKPSPSVQNQNQQDNKPKRRALTENERRVIRETNITEERFWTLMEAGNVVSEWKKEGAK